MLSLGKLLELTIAGREPAQKTQMTVAGTRLRWLASGALEVTPHPQRDCGLDVLLSAGLHGNETAPLEVLDDLLHAIARGELQPAARVLFVLGNAEALRAGVRYLEQDLNRLFNGHHDISSGAEAMRAGELERLAASFFNEPGRQRVHIDLHSPPRGSRVERFAVLPWQEPAGPGPEQQAWLMALGVQAVLLHSKPGATFCAYTGQALGAQALSLELGRRGGSPANLTGVEAVFRALLAGKQPPASGNAALQQFQVVHEVIKRSDEFRLQLPQDVEHFDELPRGTLLAVDGSSRWLVEEDNVRIVFPSARVACGQAAGLLVVPV